jgi:hypothetical protein
MSATLHGMTNGSADATLRPAEPPTKYEHREA